MIQIDPSNRPTFDPPRSSLPGEITFKLMILVSMLAFAFAWLIEPRY